jgi:Zn-finger nucleic acid-binding protein
MTSIDLLLAVSDPSDLEKIISKKTVTKPHVEKVKRILPYVEIAPPLAPVILPKDDPNAYMRVGQVQDIEDCTCNRCGNRWQQLGTLWDVFSRMENNVLTKTLIPADVRYREAPTLVIHPKKVPQCLSCFKQNNPNDAPVPGSLEDLLS